MDFKHIDSKEETKMNRFMVSITGDSKLAIIHAVGCLLTMRRTNCLYDCKILSGTGVGNLVLAFLAKALYDCVPGVVDGGRHDTVEKAWYVLTGSDDLDPFLDLFVTKVYQFCQDAIEGDAMVRRICNIKQWNSPWYEEIGPVLEKKYFKDLDMTDIVLSGDAVHSDHEPVFVFNGLTMDGGTPVAFTNIPNLCKSGAMTNNTPFADFVDLTLSVTPISELVMACGLPIDYEASQWVKDRQVGSSLKVDPFGLASLTVLALKCSVAANNLLLIDGLSGSVTAEHLMTDTDRHHMSVQMNQLMSSMSDSSELVRLRDHKPLPMIDTSHLLADTPCKTLIEKNMRESESDLAPLYPRHVIHTANFACAITAAYLKWYPSSAAELFVNQSIDEEYDIFHTVLGSLCLKTVPSASTLEIYKDDEEDLTVDRDNL
jgi:hypothetical protein